MENGNGQKHRLIDPEYPVRIYFRGTVFENAATAFAAAKVDRTRPDAMELIEKISKMSPAEAQEFTKDMESDEFTRYGDRMKRMIEIQKFSSPYLFKALADGIDNYPERYPERYVGIRNEVAKTISYNEADERVNHGIKFYMSAFGSRDGGYSREDGSLPIPEEAKKRMEDVIRKYCALGAWVRSGGAEGMDNIAEGAAAGRCTAYLPMNEFGNRSAGVDGAVRAVSTKQSKASVEALHPDPESLRMQDEEGKEKWSIKEHLIERNWQIIHGQDGPAYRSLFAVCWTPGGRETGGSAQTMRDARVSVSKGDLGIPVFNLANDEDYRVLMEDLPKELGSKLENGEYRREDLAACPSLKRKLAERKEIFILDMQDPAKSVRWLKNDTGKWEKSDHLHDAPPKEKRRSQTDRWKNASRTSSARKKDDDGIPF